MYINSCDPYISCIITLPKKAFFKEEMCEVLFDGRNSSGSSDRSLSVVGDVGHVNAPQSG